MRIITQLLQVMLRNLTVQEALLIFQKSSLPNLLVQSNQSSSCINRIASLNKDLADCTVCRSNDLSLHLHGFHNNYYFAKFNCLSFRYFDVQDFTWHRSFYGSCAAGAAAGAGAGAAAGAGAGAGAGAAATGAGAAVSVPVRMPEEPVLPELLHHYDPEICMLLIFLLQLRISFH